MQARRRKWNEDGAAATLPAADPAWRPPAASLAGPGPVSVNPAGQDATLTALEDTLFFFTLAHFGFSDGAGDTDSFAAVIIASEPTGGNLFFDGQAIGEGSIIVVADIVAGRLGYEAGLNQNGPAYASFTFSVADSAAEFDQSPNRITFNITPVNDAPVYSNFNSFSAGTFNEGSSTPSYLDFMHNGTLADIDSIDLAGGHLRVSITANRVATEDVLAITPDAQVSVPAMTAGSSVSVGGVVIGTIAAGGTGRNGEDLVVEFNGQATTPRVTLLVRALTYFNTNPDNPSQASRSVAIILNDGDGPQLGTTTVQAHVMGYNDAPALSAPTLTQLSYLPGNSAVALWAGVTVSDPDQQANFINGSLSMSGGGAGSRFELIGTRFTVVAGFALTDTVTGQQIGSLSLSAGSALVSGLTSAATPEVVNALIQSFGFRTEGANPALGTFAFNMSFFDGHSGGFGGGLTSNTVSQSISIGSTASTAIIDLNGNGPGTDGQNLYRENGEPVPIFMSALHVFGPNGGTQIDRATVTLNSVMAGDLFTYGTLPAGVTAVATVTESRITFVFSGTATAASYQALLAGIRFSSTSEDPFGNRWVAATVEFGGVASPEAQTMIYLAAVDDPAIARDDAFATTEAGIVTGSVFVDNGAGADSDVDGTPFITAVNGGGGVNQQIQLPSGARLQLNGGGSFTYDPNHAFDATPGAASGAANRTVADSFTYTLQGGGTATVTITIAGVDSNDRIGGTAGFDFLHGGTGADVFVFAVPAETELEGRRSDGVKYLPDRIADFVAGEDRIDLSAIDAVAGTAPNDAFSFIGAAAFSGQAGQLRCVRIGDETHVFGDLDGNGIADFEIVANAPLLQASDFIL